MTLLTLTHDDGTDDAPLFTVKLWCRVNRHRLVWQLSLQAATSSEAVNKALRVGMTLGYNVNECVHTVKELA